jgi:hypothetical protein
MMCHQGAVGGQDIQCAPLCEMCMGCSHLPTKEQCPSERSVCRQGEDRVRLVLGPGEQVLRQLAHRLPP